MLQMIHSLHLHRLKTDHADNKLVCNLSGLGKTDLLQICWFRTGERFTPCQKISDKKKISKDKKFQFETLFCHVTTDEILHLNCVFGLQ